MRSAMRAGSPSSSTAGRTRKRARREASHSSVNSRPPPKVRVEGTWSLFQAAANKGRKSMRDRNLLRFAGAFTVSAGLMMGGGAHAADPDAALAALASKVLSLGPNGESPQPASAVTLSDEELAKIKGMKAKAALVFHYGGNDWSQAQLDGLKAEFAKMGIDVVAVTDAGFKPEKQVSDIETVLAQKPNIIVSIPTDPVATAGAYKAAADAGVKLVFMDNVPKGLAVGKDYVSVVSADNYG